MRRTLSRVLCSVWHHITASDMTFPRSVGSGTAGLTIGATTYYRGDISSHVFDVPLKSSIAVKASDMMAIPYTNTCGAPCHTTMP